jgi:hypothetical protein
MSDEEQPPPPHPKGTRDFKTKPQDTTEYAFPISTGDLQERRVTVSLYRRQVRVDIREFYLSDNEWKPSKKGISLNIEQWRKLEGFQSLIDEAIAELGGGEYTQMISSDASFCRSLSRF